MVPFETCIESLNSEPSSSCLEAKTFMFAYNKQERGVMSTDVSEDIRDIKSILERMEAQIDSRLIETEEPEEDEVAKIEDYEKRKKEDKVELHEMHRCRSLRKGQFTA